MRIAVFVAVIVLLFSALVFTPKTDYIARAKEASFELEVMLVFQGGVKEGWKLYWPRFVEETGAVLWAEDRETVAFYVPAGGGTAFFFARKDAGEDVHAFALTNAHVVEASVDLKKRAKDTYDKIFSYVLQAPRPLLCPNFTHFDSSPTCATGAGADVRFYDPFLDYAVIRFEYLDKQTADSFTYLTLGDERTMKPGDPVAMIGAGVGIEDLVERGEWLPAQVPYFVDSRVWRWGLPFDANTVGGFSGSPVISLKTGEVVALSRGALLDPRGSGRSVAIGIPISLIRQALALNGFPVGAFR